MSQARDRVVAARELLRSKHPEAAVSAAYYAMLYAARAALSEDDENARTHRGTWHLFRQRYVVSDAFDSNLYDLAQQAQTAHEQGDYEAVQPSDKDTERYVEGAATFVSAVERMLAA